MRKGGQMSNPLDVVLSDDPEVMEFLRFSHSREGLWHVKGKEDPAYAQYVLPDHKVPALSDEQLKELDRATEKLDALEFSWENINRWICEKMWIVSGCYCGGTKFAAGFLQRLGVRAEHETLFNADGRCAGKSMVAARNTVDVSGGASVWLPTFPNARMIWLVRNPVDTINSQYYYRNQSDGKTINFQRDMLARYSMNFMHGPALVWRVESLSDQMQVLQILGIRPKPGDLERARKADRNSKKRESKVNPATWDDLIPPLRQWAEDLGYDENGLRKEYR